METSPTPGPAPDPNPAPKPAPVTDHEKFEDILANDRKLRLLNRRLDKAWTDDKRYRERMMKAAAPYYYKAEKAKAKVKKPRTQPSDITHLIKLRRNELLRAFAERAAKQRLRRVVKEVKLDVFTKFMIKQDELNQPKGPKLTHL